MRLSIWLIRSVVLIVAATNVAIGQSHTLVSVGDHRLDVVREGTGGPAVIFETGLADSLNVWLPMLHTVAAYTTAVAYSRAGFGRSDPGPSDHSVPHAVTDLHELLHRLQIKPPYVLVARSYGSLISRLYVSRYPKEVAGIVLVDGTHEQQVQRFGTLDSTYPRKFRQYFDSVLRTFAAGSASSGDNRDGQNSGGGYGAGPQAPARYSNRRPDEHEIG